MGRFAERVSEVTGTDVKEVVGAVHGSSPVSVADEPTLRVLVDALRSEPDTAVGDRYRGRPATALNELAGADGPLGEAARSGWAPRVSAPSTPSTYWRRGQSGTGISCLATFAPQPRAGSLRPIPNRSWPSSGCNSAAARLPRTSSTPSSPTPVAAWRCATRGFSTTTTGQPA